MEIAVRNLYSSYRKPMLRFFVYKGASADMAEDVFQDVMIKVIKAAQTFTGAGTLQAWIWQIARNTLIEHFRKAPPFDPLPPDDKVEESELRNMSADECVTRGIEEFGKTEPDRCYALTLQMDGISIINIGEILGRTEQATKQYLYECRKKLGPFIEHCFKLLTD